MSDPIVCLSGAGNISQTNVNLTTLCSAPADRPVYVVLGVRARQNDVLPPKAVATLTEGSLACTVTANTGESAACAVTVRDGVLSTLQTSQTPENYTLTASWETTTTAAYTYTLQSGQQLDIYAAATFGEIITSGLLLAVIAVLVLRFCYQMVVGK